MIGRTLSHYKVLEKIGQGGMGEVYLAQDTRLGRDVALKVLPAEVAENQERRARFQREAKAIAALDHPNIVQVFSVEEAEGIHFITMQLVQGKTLAELLPKHGFPLRTFFNIAIPMADAVAAAHRAGITHRDLKPDNVMVTDERRVKVLDFGLAKPTAALPLDTEGQTAAKTDEGVVVGTVSYMSPEQAEGKPVDHRSDIFALGIILYEMATGTRPFTGETSAAVLSSILRDTPSSIAEVNPGLPRDLGKILRRCLAKETTRRYQTAADLRNELEELNEELETGDVVLGKSASSTPAKSTGTLLLATVGVLAVLGMVIYLGFRTDERYPTSISSTFTPLTSQPGVELFPSMSPEGELVVYSSRSSGDWDVYLLRVGGRNPINLTDDSDSVDTQPALSHDGQRIAFRSSRGGGGIFVMGTTGEFVHQVTDFGYNPDWSPDGRNIAFATESISYDPLDRPTKSELWMVDRETRETHRVTEADAVQPSWSPGGQRIAFWGLLSGTGQRDVFTVSSNGGEPRAVTADPAIDWNPVWSPDGRYLFFASDRGGANSFWRVSIDQATGEVHGEPEPFALPATFASNISFSEDSKRMVYVSSSSEKRIYSVALNSATLDVTGEPALAVQEVRQVDAPTVSPDGTWVAFSIEGPPEDLAITEPSGSAWRLLTQDPHRDRGPAFSPDGTQLSFYSDRGGSYDIWVVGTDGTGLRALTQDPTVNVAYPFWSPDGKRLGFARQGLAGALIDVDTPWSEQTPESLPPYPDENLRFDPVAWSPDGLRIVGHTTSRGGVRAGIATLELASKTFDRLTDFGAYPTWAKDSRNVVFSGTEAAGMWGADRESEEGLLFVVDRITREYRELLRIPGASLQRPELTRDNERVYFVLNRVEADIWMQTLDEEAAARQ